MSGILGYHNREAVRVKVKKCEGLMQPEYRKFSVDPQITSFEVLRSLLARAFDIKGEFTISYLARDDEGQETYLSLLSDWDLDAAFLSSSDPCLQLKTELKPFEEGLDDWDIITPVDLTRTRASGVSLDKQSFTGTLLNHMERTFNLVQRALNIGDNENSAENARAVKAAMSDSEFHNYLDSEGRLVKPKELRLSVYRGGVEPSLRKVVWKHILNVYPEGLSGKERMAYMKRKSAEYEKLRETWKATMDNQKDQNLFVLNMVTNMVRKDVLRTDRTHQFYAGADDNKNVASLFNVLTTYALNHPSVSYCQGMSDLASPILVIMKDEAQAYVCFCALMERLKPNFQLDGAAMTTKFQHLSELLRYYDPHFFEYLKTQAADDLLFCYRWLLLELKREFAFDDALLMLEVLWSSLPPSPPSRDLKLYEVEFAAERVDDGPRSPAIRSRENPYTKVRAIRKQNSANSIKALVVKMAAAEGEFSSLRSRGHSANLMDRDSCREEEGDYSEGGNPPDSTSSSSSSEQERDRLAPNQIGVVSERRRGSRGGANDGESSADDSQEYPPMTTSITRELRIDLENLNRHIPGSRNYYLNQTPPLKAAAFPTSHDSDPADNSESSRRSSSIAASGCPAPLLEKRARGEEEGPDTGSWTSDDQSESDNVHGIGALGRRRKCSDFLRVNGLTLNAAKEGENPVEGGQFCTTPDEQRDIDFDERNEPSADSICNGEILENEACPDDSAPHLKGVIPIRLIRSSSGNEDAPRTRRLSGDSDASASSSAATSSASSDADQRHPAVVANCSEGYVSDSAASSKEASARLGSSGRSQLVDSGLMGEPAPTPGEEASEFCGKSNRGVGIPSPNELGGGNPFMLFICLTLLMQHREVIVRSRMDYNELAMHFDKMVRKHHVLRVLRQARAMFAEYLRLGWREDSWDSNADDSDNTLPV